MFRNNSGWGPACALLFPDDRLLTITCQRRRDPSKEAWPPILNAQSALGSVLHTRAAGQGLGTRRQLANSLCREATLTCCLCFKAGSSHVPRARFQAQSLAAERWYSSTAPNLTSLSAACLAPEGRQRTIGTLPTRRPSPLPVRKLKFAHTNQVPVARGAAGRHGRHSARPSGGDCAAPGAPRMGDRLGSGTPMARPACGSRHRGAESRNAGSPNADY